MSPIAIAAAAVCSLAALCCIFLLCFAVYAQHCGFGGRFQKKDYLKYFTAEDFGLKTLPAATKCGGIRLNGFIYYKGELSSAERLVIFSHGMGPGQCSYTTEIARFCSEGCAVLAFDCIGCGMSGGKSLGGLENSTRSLVAAYEYARSVPLLSGVKIFFVGHSMGAYSALCATKFVRPDGVVAFSAPERPSLMVAHFAEKVTSGWFSRVMRPFVKVVTFFRFGRYADLSASRCIKRSGVPALVFQGDRDADVPFELSACARVNGGNNVRAEVCSGKAHNVYNTFAAEGLLKRLKDGILRMNEMNDGERAEFFSSQDYGAICEEDEAVMGEVLRFIKDC